MLVGEWMGHPAAEVAESVTRLLTAALDGVKGSTAIRGSSMSGMAYVDLSFDSAAALTRGRREVLARVAALRPLLPAGLRLRVGPEASSTGWVFQYALVAPSLRGAMGAAAAGGPSLLSMRRLQDERLRPALEAVPGVAEVASLGGETEEILVETTPDRLREKGLALSDLVAAVRRALAAPAPPDLEATELPGHTLLGAVARVRTVRAMASGAADLDGGTPVVGGIVVARRGADVTALIAGVKAVLERERPPPAAGIELVTLYDRSALAGRVEHTLFRALSEEVAVVVLVVLAFLLHARSALVPLATLPLVIVLTFAAMWALGVPADVMSLGGIGIALGMAIDAELVALEACHRRLESLPPRAPEAERRARIVAAAGSFAPAILTSLVIAALAFLPVFAFTGETGRLLRPLALTKTLVILSAAILAPTLAPALRARLLRGRIVPELGNPLTRALVAAYRPFVRFALARPAFTLATAALLALSCLPIIGRLGREFLPRVDEGDLLFMPTTAPGVPDDDAALQLARQDRAIRRHPEVRLVFGKVGRADTATDPAPYSMAETLVALKPRSEWPRYSRQRWYSSWAPDVVKSVLRLVWPDDSPATVPELVERLDRAARLPGWTNGWTAPIRARMDMMSTGIRTPVGIRIVARDPARLDELGAAVRDAVQGLPGARGAVYESQGGETRLVFVPDADDLARFGVGAAPAQALADLLVSGAQLGEVAARPPAPPLRVRLSLTSPSAPKPLEDLLREATVRVGAGAPIPLALLGRPAFVTVPAVIRAERGELAGYVTVDLDEGTELSGWIERAQRELGRALHLDAGERLEWTGQYQLLAAGQRRLLVVAPIAALAMLVLLLVQFRSVTEALIVLASVPFALVGSFWTLYLAGYALSAPVWVGLLSVVGLAMQTGVVMVVYVDEAFHRRVREGRLRTRDDIVEAHAEGTVRRLRPKVMTITTMAAGLLPLLWAQGAGAEIMRRVAAPMVGGLITSAFLTLEVIPVLYTLWRTHQLRAARRRGLPIEAIVGRPPPWARCD